MTNFKTSANSKIYIVRMRRSGLCTMCTLDCVHCELCNARIVHVQCSRCVRECKCYWFCVCVIWTSILIVSFVSNGCVCAGFCFTCFGCIWCNPCEGQITAHNIHISNAVTNNGTANEIVIAVTTLCFAPGLIPLSISSFSLFAIAYYYYFQLMRSSFRLHFNIITQGMHSFDSETITTTATATMPMLEHRDVHIKFDCKGKLPLKLTLHSNGRATHILPLLWTFNLTRNICNILNDLAQEMPLMCN